jgi:hypothetical protein
MQHFLKGTSGAARHGGVPRERKRLPQISYLRYDVWNDRKTVGLDIYLMHRQSSSWTTIQQKSHIPTYRDLARIMTWCEVRGLLPVCRLLAANIFDLFFTRAFSEKCYFFPVGFLFHEEGSPLPTRIFEFRRCGKVDNKNRRSSKICPGASCAGHRTRRPSS